MLRAVNFKRAVACDALNPHIGQKFIRRSHIDALIANRNARRPVGFTKVLFINFLRAANERRNSTAKILPERR